jgi:hypothetical protein
MDARSRRRFAFVLTPSLRVPDRAGGVRLAGSAITDPADVLAAADPLVSTVEERGQQPGQRLLVFRGKHVNKVGQRAAACGEDTARRLGPGPSGMNRYPPSRDRAATPLHQAVSLE